VFHEVLGSQRHRECTDIDVDEESLSWTCGDR
jgi:hypothetical protein